MFEKLWKNIISHWVASRISKREQPGDLSFCWEMPGPRFQGLEIEQILNFIVRGANKRRIQVQRAADGRVIALRAMSSHSGPRCDLSLMPYVKIDTEENVFGFHMTTVASSSPWLLASCILFL